MSNTISLALHAPDFALEKNASGSRYTLSFKDGEGAQVAVDVTLDTAVLELLIRQASALLPSPNPELTPLEVNASWRESAWPLKRLSDNAWRLLLREVQVESLIYVLWFLKDEGLAKAVMRNMSVRAAAMTADDLIAKFQGRDPDNLPQDALLLKGAHQSLKEMLDILNRLVDEGQIEEDFS
jgi:hypothetical protein